MKKIREYIYWTGLWWPLWLLLEILALHYGLIDAWGFDCKSINKILGLAAQLFGGLFILYSINSNLSLFKESSLFEKLCALIKSFPAIKSRIVHPMSAAITASSGLKAKHYKVKPVEKIEDEIENLKSELSYLHENFNEHVVDMNNRIAVIRRSTSARLHNIEYDLGAFKSKVETMTTSGLDWQIFGVFLVIYGSLSSFYA